MRMLNTDQIPSETHEKPSLLAPYLLQQQSSANLGRSLGINPALRATKPLTLLGS